MTEITEDGQIEFDTSLPEIEDAVIAQYEAQNGEKATLSEEGEAVEATPEESPGPEPVAAEGEAESEPEIDWQARAVEAEEQAKNANHSAAQARLAQKATDDRVDALIAAQQAAAVPVPEPTPEIDFDEDPKAWLQQQSEQQLHAVKEAVAELKPVELTQEERQYNQLAEFMDDAKESEAEFTKGHPDYLEAVGSSQKRLAESMHGIYGGGPLKNDQGQPIIDNQGNTYPRFMWEANKAEFAMVQAWKAAGKDPAAEYYARAQGEGYEAKTGGGSLGSAPESAPAETQASQVRKGLENSRSVGKSSGTGGKMRANEMTADEWQRLNESHDTEDKAWVAGLWNYNSGSIANELMQNGRARIPDNVKPIYT